MVLNTIYCDFICNTILIFLSYIEEYKVSLKKEYNNVPQNELNEIPKTIQENGTNLVNHYIISYLKQFYIYMTLEYLVLY